MKKIILCFLLLALAFQLFSQPLPIPEGAEMRIVSRLIYDGDGLRVLNPSTGSVESVRESQTDAPDFRNSRCTTTQPFADSARYFARSLIHVGDTVFIDYRPYTGKKRNSFSRPLAYIYLKDGTLLNLLVIQKGWAWYTPAKGVKDLGIAESMETAMTEAKAAKRGLWKGSFDADGKWVAPQRPSIWREGHRYGAKKGR